MAVFAMTAWLTNSDATAQRGPHHGPVEPGERLEKHIQMMDERLDLTDAQEAQIRALLEGHAADMRAWRENNTAATREERRDHMRESMTDLRSEIDAILTDDQAETLEAMHERMQDRREKRRDRRDRVKANVYEELDLTAEQRDRMRSLREDHRAAMQQWRAQHPDATREERRAWMREQFKSHRAAMAEIFTDEQRRTLREMRAKMEARREQWRGRREQKQQEWRERHRLNDDNDAAEQSSESAAESRLGLENYPNPFNPSTEIRFQLPEGGAVELNVYDAQGRHVETLLNETRSAGSHSVTFEAGDLPSGIYLYRLSFGDRVETGRMTLTK